jgi:hypothetical protein
VTAIGCALTRIISLSASKKWLVYSLMSMRSWQTWKMEDVALQRFFDSSSSSNSSSHSSYDSSANSSSDCSSESYYSSFERSSFSVNKH